MAGSFHVLTLGCKLNQFDSAVLEADLRARGLAASAKATGASVVVLNTCTVTHRADADARRLARRLRRENPGCLLVATGCLAERDPEALEALPEIDLVVRRADRTRIGALIAAAAPPELAGGLTDPGPVPSCAGGLSFGDRTRAFLKVQEGCALRCAYCIIPQVRGASTSVPPDQVVQGLESLIAGGFREIVLTGVNTGDYGVDLSPRTDLAALLRRLLRVPGLGRLRLNSLEPRTVTPEIVELLAGEARLAPHLQIPLQSASDRVLGAMRRNYRASFYGRLIEELRRRVPAAALGADVIVGHPGEGDREFETTLRFIAASPLNYLHVFSYSPRPGTDASRRDDANPPSVITERSARLRELGGELAARFRGTFVGRTLEALCYDTRREDGRLRALTGNFIELGLDAPDAARNRLLPVRLTAASPQGALAVPA